MSAFFNADTDIVQVGFAGTNGSITLTSGSHSDRRAVVMLMGV